MKSSKWHSCNFWARQGRKWKFCNFWAGQAGQRGPSPPFLIVPRKLQNFNFEFFKGCKAQNGTFATSGQGRAGNGSFVTSGHGRAGQGRGRPALPSRLSTPQIAKFQFRAFQGLKAQNGIFATSRQGRAGNGTCAPFGQGRAGQRAEGTRPSLPDCHPSSELALLQLLGSFTVSLSHPQAIQMAAGTHHGPAKEGRATKQLSQAWHSPTKPHRRGLSQI